MNEQEVAKNILLNRICPTCVYQNRPNQHIHCDKEINRPQYNMCNEWVDLEKTVDEIMEGIEDDDRKRNSQKYTPR